MNIIRKRLLERLWMLLSISSLMIFTACVNPQEGGDKATTKVENTEIIIDGGSDHNNNTNTVCDPFNNQSTISRDHGLLGSLTYLPPSLPKYSSVQEYLINGTKIDADLYFNQVNVPTRPFNQGFFTQSGTQLTTPEGNPLYEWFALQLKSSIKLQSTDRTGRYQFAILSDDGSVLRIKNGANFRTLINNDGTHPTKLACATEPVFFDSSTELPIEIDYYQGPRYHIALVLLWREWPEDGSENPVADPACGLSGNQTFFDSSVSPPREMPLWLGMKDRGWKAIPMENYYLPTSVASGNPCPVDPVEDDTNDPNTDFMIVGFDATTDSNSIFVIWQTPGYPSSSQILYGTDPNNLDQSTTIDPTLTDVHQVTISGLSSNTRYYIQSISVEASGRIIQSNIISKTTK